MARFPSAALFFFLAALISHAFSLPLLRRASISQLKADIQLATGDITGIAQQVATATWAHRLASDGADTTSAFASAGGDIQKCIAEMNNISGSVDAADANIILSLAKDFANTVTEMLSTVRSKYPYYKRVNGTWNILNGLRNLSGGVQGMTEKLESVLPSQSQGVASGLQQQMGPAFQQTISLYSSS